MVVITSCSQIFYVSQQLMVVFSCQILFYLTLTCRQHFVNKKKLLMLGRK